MNIQLNMTNQQKPVQFKMNLSKPNKKTATNAITNAVDTYGCAVENNSPQKQENFIKRIYHSAKEKFINSVGIKQHSDKKKLKTGKSKLEETNGINSTKIQRGPLDPDFCVDYEKRTAGLRKGEDVTSLWVRQNKDLLSDIGWSSDINDGDMLIRNINKDKKAFVKVVDNTYADKKALHIDSLRKEYINIDPEKQKEKSLLGLDALIKYGTREDMLGLKIPYKASEDNDVMQKYSQLIRKVGKPEDSVILSPKLDDSYTDIFNDSTKKELMKTVKKLMVDDAPSEMWKNAEFAEYLQYKEYSKSEDPEMAEMAKAIMKRLSDENPWMLK